MMNETITLTETIKLLNGLLALDRPAIAALVANRVPCNDALAAHESVQVQPQHGGHHVGLLGILNGLWGTFNGVDGPIAVVWDNGYLVEFMDMREFGKR